MPLSEIFLWAAFWLVTGPCGLVGLMLLLGGLIEREFDAAGYGLLLLFCTLFFGALVLWSAGY